MKFVPQFLKYIIFKANFMVHSINLGVLIHQVIKSIINELNNEMMFSKI